VETGKARGLPIQPHSLRGVSRSDGSFVDLASLNASSEDGMFKYSKTDWMKDVLANQEKKEQKDKAKRKGFAVEPVEASASKSILPEFGSYSSGQVLANIMGGKSLMDAFNSSAQPSSCTQSGLLRGHAKEVLGVALSLDGLRCASCSVDGTVRMWDLTTGTQVAICEGHKDWVWGVSITNDGRLVASCGKDHSARIWTYEGELKQVVQHKGEVLGVALTSDHKLLVTGQGKSVFVWQVRDGSKVVELRKHTDLVRGVSATETGTRIASCSKDCTIIIWETANAAALFILTGHTAVVRAVHITTAGVISCSNDKTVRLWNAATGKCEIIMHGHTGDVRDVCMNANNSVAVSCSFDQTVKVWDLRTGKEVASLTGHTDKVFGVAVNGEGSVAVSCSWDMSIRIWDIDTGQNLDELAPPSALNSFLGRGSSFVKLPFATPTRIQAHDVREIQAHEKEILGVAITADGNEAVTCSVDGTIRLWELDTGEQLVKLEGHTDWAWGVVITPDGARAASCGRDRVVLVWDMVLRRIWKKLVHVGEVVCVALFDDGSTAVTGQGKDVLVWNVILSKLTATLPGHTETVRCVAISNGRIVSGSQDASLRVWAFDGDKWSCNQVLKGHSHTVRGVSVQSNVILSGSQDQSLRTWDLENGQEISTMHGHNGDVRAVGLSNNGKRAVSGSFDRTVRIWDVESGEEVSQLEGHTDKILGVGICGDGSRAVSCSWDASLRVWDLSDDPVDHHILQPPSATSSRRPAPDSIIGGQSIVGAVKAALNRSAGYDEIQTDSDSNESGRSTPEGPTSGGGIGGLPDGAGRRKRIRVNVEEEEGLPIEDGEDAAKGVGRLGEAIQRFLGRKDDVDLDEDEQEWQRSVLADQRRRHGDIDPENAHEMSRLTGDDVDYEEDEEDEKRRKEKDKARHRSSVALALGFVCFFPWCAGLILDGGLKSKDRITRNINRLAVFFMCCVLVAAIAVVGVRFTVKDNAFCLYASQCDSFCATVCTGCNQCISYDHWWCHQPRGENKKGFCSSEDISKDDFIQRPKLGLEPIYIPSIACSRGCGCNSCLNQKGNWCRYPLAPSATRTLPAAPNLTEPWMSARKQRSSQTGWQGTISLFTFGGGGDAGGDGQDQDLLRARVVRQGLLRREMHSHTKQPAHDLSMLRQAQWSFDGDDGYCDTHVTPEGQDDRTPSEHPELCDDNSCCCDLDGCHPTKCTT
jgi:WD40 repeat protein